MTAAPLIDRYSQLLPDTPRLRLLRKMVCVSSGALVAAMMIFWVFIRGLIVALFYVMSLALFVSPQINPLSFGMGMAIMFSAAFCIMLFDTKWTAAATFALLLFGYFPATAVMTHSLRGGYPLDPGSDLQLAAIGLMLAFCLYGMLEAWRTYRSSYEVIAQERADYFVKLNDPKTEVQALATLMRRYVRRAVLSPRRYLHRYTDRMIAVVCPDIDENTQVDLERFSEITGRRLYRSVATMYVSKSTGRRWEFWKRKRTPQQVTAFIVYRIGHQPPSEISDSSKSTIFSERVVIPDSKKPR